MQDETHIRRARATHRFGLTMVEMLIAVAILAVLASVVLVASKALSKSQARASANQQMASIANAIDRYAGFWPRWEAGRELLADRGWPDHIPGRLFSTTFYKQVQDFNNDGDFDVMDGITIGSSAAGGGADRVGRGDVLSANIALTYALTTGVGAGPYLKLDDERALIQPAESPARLPKPNGGPSLMLVDPWGTPYRYFWVCRVPDSKKGYLPVTSMNLSDPDFSKADGYVLESAGPGGRFGNVWKKNPSRRETDEASDNIVIMP